MKLKNSYVLLIAMAIFLLVSIGSVCANEDVAADSDVPLADSDIDVSLSNDGTDVPDDNNNEKATQEKINTTVNAADTRINEKADKNISVTVKDNESQEIKNITKNNLTVTEEGKNISFDYNNSIITIKDTLKVGNHSLLIKYLGNDLYNGSSIIIKLSIYMNNTLNVPSSVDSDGNKITIPINLTDGVDDKTDLLNNDNTQVMLKYGETNETITVDWTNVANTKKIEIENLEGKIPATLIIKYTENGKSQTKNVAIRFKTNTNVNVTRIDINENENITIKVNVTGANNKQVNITDKDLTISSGKFTYNSTTGELNITGLKKGINNIVIVYKGNAVNNTSNATITVNVRGAIEINPNATSVNVNSTKIVEIRINNITNGVDTFDFDANDINITVSYKDGNATKNITYTRLSIINNTITLTLDNGNFTTAIVKITYNETTTKNITLNRIYNAIIRPVTNEVGYQEDFKFEVIDADDKTILSNKNITVSGFMWQKWKHQGSSWSIEYTKSSQTITTNENGIATLRNYGFYTGLFLSDYVVLPVGEYNFTLSGSGDVKGTNKTMIKINKINVTITVDDFKEYYGTDKKVKITVTNSKTGTPIIGTLVHLYMPQTSGKDYYLQTNENGTSEIAVNVLVGGKYDLTVSSNDTKNINDNSTKTTITIMKIPVTISASGLTVYYNTGATATIKVTKDGKPVSGMYLLVRLYTTSTKYNDYLFQTNDKGQVSFSASLTVGKHKMIINSADNRYEASQVTKTITVKKASAKITAKKVTDYYKGVKYFTVKLTNTKNNKPIYDAKLNIKVFVSKNRYYNYNGHTGANGEIRLSLETLKPGTYKVVVAGADSKDFTAEEVTSKIVIKKAPAKLTPKKLTAKKGAKKYFKVTVKNKKTKKVIKGVKIKIKVYTGKKAKTFTAKTNAKGIAKILTNKLKVGKHKVVVASADKYVTAKKAKSTIKITK